jgi:beta-glucosidase/6-phospho-beta-glucosidase/beta-galactosidase
MSSPLFSSFVLGGFETSTHRRYDGVQLDIIAATFHDRHMAEDYALLRGIGITGARDALRWHLIDRAAGQYDWSSFLPALRAAKHAQIQVVWDLCHYGLPTGLDIWSCDFVDRFAAFAEAAASVIRSESDEIPIYCLINEISFWSWAGGDNARIYPCCIGRGAELKRQLVRATLAATDRIRTIDHRARFMQSEPVINIVSDPLKPEDQDRAEAYRLAQFEVWDMIAGRLAPDLGGAEAYLDLIGVNFYWNNQWILDSAPMGLGHFLYRPFNHMLRDTYDRYGRPMVVAETGAEEPNGVGWFRYVAGEVRAALQAGMPIEAMCVYPVMDYPGWDDGRHCPCGPIALSEDWQRRRVRAEITDQLIEEQARFAALRLFGGGAIRAERNPTLETLIDYVDPSLPPFGPGSG